jgi:hypothetical protein
MYNLLAPPAGPPPPPPPPPATPVSTILRTTTTAATPAADLARTAGVLTFNVANALIMAPARQYELKYDQKSSMLLLRDRAQPQVRGGQQETLREAQAGDSA